MKKKPKQKKNHPNYAFRNKERRIHFRGWWQIIYGSIKKKNNVKYVYVAEKCKLTTFWNVDKAKQKSGSNEIESREKKFRTKKRSLTSRYMSTALR